MPKMIKILPFAYLLYKFYFVFINTNVQKIAVSIIVLAYIYLNYKNQFSPEDRGRFNTCLLAFFVICAFAVVMPLIHRTGDYSYLRKLLTNFNELLAWIAFVIFVKKESNGNELETLTDYFCSITCLYILFTITSIFFRGLRTFWQSKVYFTEKELFELQYAKYLGRFGWDGFAGFNATFMCSFGVLLCLVCLNIRNKDVKSSINDKKLYAYIVAMIIGNVLYGRTGLVASIVIIMIYTVKTVIVNNKILYLLGSLFFLAFCFFVVWYFKETNLAFSALYNWAFEPVINYFNGNGFTATSLVSLKKMYVKPPLKTIFVGDGYYTDALSGAYYMSTDVGALRLLYLWGIVPTMISYILTIGTFQKTLLNGKLNRLLLAVMLVLFEAKGEVYRLLLYMLAAISLLGISNMRHRYIKFVFGGRR